MRRFFRRPKQHVDENQAVIVGALRAAGATVQSLALVGDGCPDLAVGFRRVTYLLEVKRAVETSARRSAGGRRAVYRSDVQLRETQEAWHRNWRGLPVAVVHTPEEALRAIGATEAA